MKRLICIDPGLDGTGVAVFDLKPVETLAFGYPAEHLRTLKTITTPAEMRISARLSAIRHAIEEVITEARAVRFVVGDEIIILIEEPAIPGQYGERQGRQRGGRQINAGAMSKFYAAWGVIAACAAPYEHRFVKAGWSKEKKRDLVEKALVRFPPKTGLELPKRSLGQDKIDAIAIGLTWEGWRVR